MEGIKRYVDPELLKNKTVKTPYPHIKIKDLNKCIPLVVNALEEGDTPLIGTFKGTTKIIKNISNSAVNISKLLRVTEIDVVFSEDDYCEVICILDYMEVSQRWI